MSAIIWFLFSVWAIECSNELVANRDSVPSILLLQPRKEGGSVHATRSDHGTRVTSEGHCSAQTEREHPPRPNDISNKHDLAQKPRTTVHERVWDQEDRRWCIRRSSQPAMARPQRQPSVGPQGEHLPWSPSPTSLPERQPGPPVAADVLHRTGHDRALLAQLFVDCSVSRRVDPTERESGELVVQRPNSREARRARPGEIPLDPVNDKLYVVW